MGRTLFLLRAFNNTWRTYLYLPRIQPLP